MRVNHNHRAFRRATSESQITVTPKSGEAPVSVSLKDDGLTLTGDGFDHSITVRDGRATIASNKSPETSATVPVPQNGDPYSDGQPKGKLETATRSALGVASYLTGIPLNVFTGEKPGRVYLNLGHRPELGMREDGTRQGGRYRARAIDRDPSGVWTMTGADGVDFKTSSDWRQSDDHTDTFTFKKSPRGPVRFSYLMPATMEMTDATGKQLHFYQGHELMSGNNFSEQAQSSISSIWRDAGRPGEVPQAAKVTNYVFDTTYPQDDDSSRYYGDHISYQIEQGLRSEDSAATWGLLENASAQGLSREQLAESLRSNR
jgi:hypothetical protein